MKRNDTFHWTPSRFMMFKARLRMKIEPLFAISRMRSAEATVFVATSAFKGYPRIEDYKDLEDAVEHLENVWTILDNWPSANNIELWKDKNPNLLEE